MGILILIYLMVHQANNNINAMMIALKMLL